MDRSLKALFREAIEEYNIEKIRACVNLFGADVNIYLDDGTPALFQALLIPVILEQFLVHPNINVNIKEPNNNATALMEACILRCC